jgi:hypothetical protein
MNTGKRENLQGKTQWRCCKHQVFSCNAKISKDIENNIVGNQSQGHTHNGNNATVLSRKAIGEIKQK